MGWRRKQKNRTENGPRWENPDPGHGCNATHVARARRWWQNFARRTERRNGQTAYKKFHTGQRRVRPDGEDE